MAQKIRVLDTTLRDGAQGEGVFFSASDKLGIVMLLDNIGVDYIEAGNPGSNPKDRAFFKSVGALNLGSSKLVAFGSTRRKGVRCEDDALLRALLEAGTEVVSVVGKSNAYQVETVLQTTPRENLDMIFETVSFLAANGREVFFDSEHFYDGFLADKDYALETLCAAARAGARQLVLCDTRGGILPQQAYEITKKVVAQFPGLSVSGHFHNDAGCAVANSIEAVRAGARDIQGTFLGIGERCGNTALSVLVPSLQLKLGYDVTAPDKLRMYTRTALHMAELSNMVVANNTPYVGVSAFAHKAGMHIDGVVKSRDSFEHLSPEAVGNKRRLVLSEMAGRAAVAEKLGGIDPEIAKDRDAVDAILKKLKQMENEGYSYESANASFTILVLRELNRLNEYYTLLSYNIFGERTESDGKVPAKAVVKVAVGAEERITVAEGDGPVEALDKSLRKALVAFFPEIERTRLVDYRVRVTEPQESTAATVRVLIDTSDGEQTWTTVGHSTDIIDASYEAIADSILYTLNQNRGNSFDS